MGFRCQKCNGISKPYEKQHKMVVKKRDKIYHYYIIKVRENYGKTKEIYTQAKPDERDKNKQIIKQFTKTGWEIVKELKICEECANEKT